LLILKARALTSGDTRGGRNETQSIEVPTDRPARVFRVLVVELCHKNDLCSHRPNVVYDMVDC